MMASIDNTIICMINPMIQNEPNFSDNGIPQSLVQLTTDLYSAAFSLAIILGKIGERYGVTLFHQLGTVGFVIMSVLCGCCKYIHGMGGFYCLCAFRLLQGTQAAILLSTTMTICADLCVQQPQIVNKAISLNSISYAIGVALGPPIGMVLAEYLDWSWCFFINVVFGIVSIFVCHFKLPTICGFKEPKFDIYGSLTLTIGLMCTVFGLVFIPPSRNVIAGSILLVIGIVILVLFYFVEIKQEYPILPQKMFKSKQILDTIAAGFFNFVLITPVSFLMPMALMNYQCDSVITVGLLSLAVPIMQIFSSILTMYLSKQFVSLWIKLISSIGIIAFIIMFGYVIGDKDIAGIVVQVIFFSFSIGIFFVTNNQFLFNVTPIDIRLIVACTLNCAREAAFCFGICLINLIQDIYINAKWHGDEFQGGTCEGEEYEEYSKIYFDSCTIVSWCLCVVAALSMFFGIKAGYAEVEKDRKCYPKKGYQKIEDNEIIEENQESSVDKDKQQ